MIIRRMPGRMDANAISRHSAGSSSFCQARAYSTFDTCFTLSLIYHLYVLFVWISYQARVGLKISYSAIVYTMVIGMLNCGSFIVHILLLGTSKVFTLSVFLPCACVHVLLPGTRRISCFVNWVFFSALFLPLFPIYLAGFDSVTTFSLFSDQMVINMAIPWFCLA